MSAPAVLAIGVLAAWMLAAICYVFRVPGIHAALKRLNWFRTFAHWTMFAASPDPRVRPGAFAIEYRDGVDGPWVMAIDGNHWRPYGFLLSPRRFIAARAHHLGQVFAAMRREGDIARFQIELQDREAVIAAYLERRHPRVQGRPRTVRVVKRFGRLAASEGEVAWQFSVGGDE